MTRSPRWLLIPTVLAALSALSSSTSADQTHPAFVQTRADTLLAAEYVAQAGGKEEILTNNDVLKMVRARLPESVILKKIRTGTIRFDVSVSALKAETGRREQRRHRGDDGG